MKPSISNHEEAQRPSPGFPKSGSVESERAASDARSADAVTYTDHERHIHCGHLAHECRGSLADRLFAVLLHERPTSAR